MTSGTEARRASGRRTSVAIVHYAAPPIVGGVEQVIARHATLMADAGHDVRIVAGSGASPDPRVTFVHVPLIDPGHPDVEALRPELEAGRVPEGFSAVVDALRGALADALAGVDVVLAHNVCSLNLNLALTAALRAIAGEGPSPGLILWHHDVAWASPYYRATLHDGAPWDLLRRPWPGAVQVAISASRRDQLAGVMGLPPASIVVVPNGLDMAGAWKLEPRTAALLARADRLRLEPLLLVPARVTPRKNIELALEVVAAMRAAGSAAGLIITGPVDPHRAIEHRYLDRLMALRERLGLAEVAWFLASEPDGAPTDAVVSDLYRLADALFLPSHDEGFGLPVLEAAINRLPIVCTDLPTLREIAGSAALYVGPGDDPGVTAARVTAYLGASEEACLARRVRSGYSWDAIYGQLIEPLLTRMAVGGAEEGR